MKKRILTMCMFILATCSILTASIVSSSAEISAKNKCPCGDAQDFEKRYLAVKAEMEDILSEECLVFPKNFDRILAIAGEREDGSLFYKLDVGLDPADDVTLVCRSNQSARLGKPRIIEPLIYPRQLEECIDEIEKACRKLGIPLEEF